MFKHYQELEDVVSLMVHCPSERSFLLAKEPNGEFWMPSSKSFRKCWKLTANKIFSELFGNETPAQCTPLRINKIWLPCHYLSNVYHVVYKAQIKSEVKKRTKLKQNIRNKYLWLNAVELERQRAHAMLRSPELAVFTLMVQGEAPKDMEPECDGGLLVEICEDNLILSGEIGAAAMAPHHQLLQSAGYSKDDQIRLYREFLVLCYPTLYMSPQVFATFMVDLGWQRAQCNNLFRAADITGRGGLSFLELMLWCAANEPATQHGGIPAEIRCRYIFRYFDTNRDLKLEYVEFKELVATARAARQLPVDALSVAKDADVCLRQLGIQPNSPLPLSEFLRGVGELRLRGTSSMLRAPRSISGYLADLQERDKEIGLVQNQRPSGSGGGAAVGDSTPSAGTDINSSRGPTSDYKMASYTVKLRREARNEMLELKNFDECREYMCPVDAVSASTARLVSGGLAGAADSTDALGPRTCPVEALAAVHYFATPIDKICNKTNHASPTIRSSTVGNKAAWAWAVSGEEVAMGQLLIKLAESVRLICSLEPRLLRLTSPVYVMGDLHGNLSALLSIENSLWPTGTALSPAKMLFLGDFVDRGPHGSEVMAYLLAAKVQRPKGVYLVRGNHETRDIQKMFTFYTDSTPFRSIMKMLQFCSECQAKYGEQEGSKIWNAINLVFDVLPLAAVVDDKVFCCHGGIPPPWVCPLITAINKVPLPLARPAEQSTIAWELLWNDPIKQTRMTASLALELTANEGFAANTRRGTGHVFDQNAIDRFLLANQLSHVVRAHELHQNGFMCQLRGRLISVFSSSHYCGGNNDSGVALLEGGKVRLIRVCIDN